MKALKIGLLAYLVFHLYTSLTINFSGYTQFDNEEYAHRLNPFGRFVAQNIDASAHQPAFVKDIIHFQSTFTGTNRGYSFFSPNVSRFNMLPLIFNSSSLVDASYNYNNIFDGEAFSVSASYGTEKNTLQRNFIAQENGISEFNLFLADKTNIFKVSSYYSKTLAPLSYPTKIVVSASYNQIEYPSIIAQQEVDVLTKVLSPSLRVQTITDNFFNFEFASKVSFTSDEVANTTYDATYTRNSFAVLLKNKKWNGNITFLYDNNHINNITYSRKNLNLGVSYTKNNMKFKVLFFQKSLKTYRKTVNIVI